MCHLSVEKTLKAVIAEIFTAPSPRTHNLYRLFELSRIYLLVAHDAIVARLNTMSVATRYPEDIATLSAEVTRKVAQDYLTKTKELLAWIKSNDTLRL